MKLNDNELIFLIKENDEYATNLLYEKYKPIIISKANSYISYANNLGIDLSDLIQEAMLGFQEAINNYKEDENVLFYTFALICIDRKLKTFIHSNNKLKNKILNEAIYFDDTKDDSSLLDFVFDENNNPLNTIIESEGQLELDIKIKDVLTNLESNIYELKINGASNLEIAKLLDIDKKVVYNAIHRIKSKIKNLNN